MEISRPQKFTHWLARPSRRGSLHRPRMGGNADGCRLNACSPLRFYIDSDRMITVGDMCIRGCDAEPSPNGEDGVRYFPPTVARKGIRPEWSISAILPVASRIIAPRTPPSEFHFVQQRRPGTTGIGTPIGIRCGRRRRAFRGSAGDNPPPPRKGRLER
jgi:hypothetical protein